MPPVQEECKAIAATGSGHGGKLANAKALIKGAAEAGCWAIMFQAYDTDLYHDEAPNIRALVEAGRLSDEPGAFAEMMRSRVIGGDWEEVLKQRGIDPKVATPEQQLDAYKERRRQWHIELSAYADKLGVKYIPSVFTENDLKEVSDLAAAGEIKLGGLGLESMDTHDPDFIRMVACAAQPRGPLVMSLGTHESVESAVEAVEVAKEVEGLEVLPLYSVSAVFGKPADPAELDLVRLKELQDSLGQPVGFSDHTIGHPRAGVETPLLALIAAGGKLAAYKAQIRLSQPDEKAPILPRMALTAAELKPRVQLLNLLNKGDFVGAPEAILPSTTLKRSPEDEIDRLPKSEAGYRELYRTIVPTRDIEEGKKLTVGDPVAKVPGNVKSCRGGVGMRAEDFVDGSVALTDLPAGRAVRSTELRAPKQVKPGGGRGPNHGRGGQAPGGVRNYRASLAPPSREPSGMRR